MQYVQYQQECIDIKLHTNCMTNDKDTSDVYLSQTLKLFLESGKDYSSYNYYDSLRPTN